MVNQDTPDLTYEDRRNARDWAEHIANCPDTSLLAEIIAARVILHAVPAPPTLADMTPKERAECRWMQCDVEGYESRAVIVSPGHSMGIAVLLDLRGEVIYEACDIITPRPDLPSLELPGDKKSDPAPALPGGWRLADHPDHGRVVVTNITPNPEGYIHFALPTDNPLGHYWWLCKPDELTYLDTNQGE